MYRHRLRPPSWTLAMRGRSGIAGAVANLFTKALGTPGALVARARTVIYQSGLGFVTTDPPPPGWTVPSQLFQQGSGQTSDLKTTVPNAYVAGGTFDVDGSGTALPSGMSLSTDGVLNVGSAAASVATGVVFGYNEPGALPILTLHGTGTNVPYMATAYPTEGAVPAGRSIVSPDDANLRASVLSTWGDGSAKVVVLAGETTVSGTKTVRLLPGAASGTALTTAAIASKFTTGITVNFGGGAQTLNTWTTPDFVWWANSQVICARYRLSCGLGSMEAVIDVHAFAGGRAFVEVVIENGKLNPATANTGNASTFPQPQTYTAATVSVNGAAITPIGGVNSTAATTTSATHQAFRAWYVSTWIGGDPGIEVTHDTASMQAHPLLYRIEKASTVNLTTTYGSDAYTPWAGVRQRASQAGTGDHASIGPLPQWEAQYLQSGDKSARNAVIQSGLALLTSTVRYRDSTTNAVPAISAVAGKTVMSTFPRTGYPFASYTSDYHWDYAHQPAAGLMAFLCRPSPCFLETAQGAALFNALGNSSGDNLLGYYYAVRGKAWGFRNIAHATFLTPDVQSTIKDALKANLAANVTYFLTWDASPIDKLNIMWDNTPTDFADFSGTDGVAAPMWQHHFFAPEIYKAHEAKLLTGAGQTNLAVLVDWALTQPVRWVNEQANGGWRYISYLTCIGVGSPPLAQSNDWGAMRAYSMTGNPATVSGPWYTGGDQDWGRTYSDPMWGQEDGANTGYQYVEPFWTSLVAAVERGVTGAEAAWSTVQSNVTNLATFRNFAQTDPRHVCYPRNK